MKLTIKSIYEQLSTTTWEYSDYSSTGETVKNTNTPAEFNYTGSPLSNLELIVGQEAYPMIYYTDANGPGSSAPVFYLYHSDELTNPIHIGTDSQIYVFTESDIGKQIVVRMEFVDEDGYLETSPFYDVVDTHGDLLTVQPPPDVTPPELVDVVLSESFFYSYDVIDAAEVGLKFKVNDGPSGVDLMSARYENESGDGFTLSVYPSNNAPQDSDGYYSVATGGIAQNSNGEYELQYITVKDLAQNLG